MQAQSDQASTGNTETEKTQDYFQTHKVKPREEVGKVRDFSYAYSCTYTRWKFFKQKGKIYTDGSLSDISTRRRISKNNVRSFSPLSYQVMILSTRLPSTEQWRRLLNKINDRDEMSTPLWLCSTQSKRNSWAPSKPEHDWKHTTAIPGPYLGSRKGVTKREMVRGNYMPEYQQMANSWAKNKVCIYKRTDSQFRQLGYVSCLIRSFPSPPNCI